MRLKGLNKYKKVVSIILIAVFMLSMAISCYAADGGLSPGKKIFDFLKEQLYFIALIVAIIIIVPLFLRKAWVGLVTTLAGTAIAVYFISDPEKIKTLGTQLYNIIFG